MSLAHGRTVEFDCFARSGWHLVVDRPAGLEDGRPDRAIDGYRFTCEFTSRSTGRARTDSGQRRRPGD
jgi:hypothetical protein